MRSLTPLDLSMALAVPIIWGINVTTLKVAVGEVPPLTVAAIRFAAVGLLLAPFFRLPRGKWKSLALLSLTLGTGHFGLLFVALSTLESGQIAIIVQLGVPFSSLLAIYFFNDRLGWRRMLGMGLSFCGVAVLYWDPAMTALRAPLLLVVVAAFMWAVANMQIKKMGDIDVHALNGWSGLMAAPQLLILSLIFEPGAIDAVTAAPWRFWAALGYTVLFSSILAYGFWYRLLRRYQVNQVVPFTLAAPLVSVIAGIAVHDERLTVFKLSGMAIVTIGVAIIVFRRPPQTPRQGVE